MKEVVLATRNSHKIREIQEIFSGLSIQFLSLASFPKAPEVVENGRSFQENAVKKASQLAAFLGKICLADDSGIEVDALHGAPGIYSARFSGPNATDDSNNQKLIKLLEKVPSSQRTARYRCVMALATPDGTIHTKEGVCEGQISLKPSGKNGFGYDPFFYYPPLKKTFGDTSPEIKNRLSHRYQALLKIKPVLLRILEIPLC